MAALGLGPNPTREQMQVALAGNLCRCTGYEAIFRAIRAAKRPAAKRSAVESTEAAP
jgi:xanthine dehydrogenase iron-sulfur cluster and FAD-binding subunit A